MTARFVYDRLRADQFEAALKQARITPGTFARIFGVNRTTVDRWIKGRLDIPPWVPVTMAMFCNGQGAKAAARRTAAAMLRYDNRYPGNGYPYLDKLTINNPELDEEV